MYDDYQIKKIFASIVLLSLILFLFYALIPFLGAILGSIVFYAIFNPLHKRLMHDYGIPKKVSAWLIIILSLLLIIAPIILVAGAVYSEVGTVRSNIGPLANYLGNYTPIASLPTINLADLASSEIGAIGSSAGHLLLSTASDVLSLALNLILLYFIFYYLLTSSDETRKKMMSLSPFNSRNTKQLITEFRNITTTAIVVSGIIAIVQGALITISFMFFGIPGAFFWGFIAAVFAFLPFVGPHLIWLPVFIIKILQHDYRVAVVFLILGIFISSLDGLLRPSLQKQMGNIHPLVSLVGVFAGVPIFGLLGIIIGPLLLSYLLLMLRMYREEYLND